MNAVVRNGKLWTVHHVGVPRNAPDHFAVQWYALDVEKDYNNEGGLLLTGRIDDFADTGISYLFPTLSVNRTNEVMMGFSGVSASTFASAYYTFRGADAPDGVVDDVVMYKVGEGPYLQTRWGDYSATVVDPLDDLSLWTMQEYARSGSNHGTWWGMMQRVDGRAPRLARTRVLDSTHIEVVFDEPMAEDAALTSPSGYLFTGGGAALSAAGVAVSTGRRLIVEVNEMTDGAAYSLMASGATDLSGNAVGADSVAFTGVGDAPVVTVDTLEINENSPMLTGTIDDPSATVRVRVAGDDQFEALNQGDGTWHLAEDTIMPLQPGRYDIQAEAEDAAGNTGTDASIDELTIFPEDHQVPATGHLAMLCCALALALLARRKLAPAIR